MASFYGSTNTGTGNTAAPSSFFKSSTNYQAFTNIETASAAAQAAAATATAVNVRTATLTMIIDGGGAAISPGIKGDIEVPFGCTITQVDLMADVSGSIVIDIWKDTYANYPPTIAGTITASAKPTLSSAVKSRDNTLVGWTTAINAGDILRFNVNSATTVQRVTISLTVTKTS